MTCLRKEQWNCECFLAACERDNSEDFSPGIWSSFPIYLISIEQNSA